ncbi:MAG: FAD-dependent oxidoreductase [Verrucomicrobia bacterium]|nr:FAD-dependent oxidoreductase [Verrucomicrobiota bacterium]
MKLKKFFLVSFFCLLSFKPLFSSPIIEDKEYPVAILGSGIAALTAAVQISQAGFEPLIITGPSPGGIIVKSHSIHNWPGEIEISGPDLIDKLQKQAEACGTLFLPGQVVDIEMAKEPFILTVQNKIDNKTTKIKARTCIIAVGALPKLLGVPGEQENLFTNIFTCAPCDGFRFKNKTVAIIGGGDSALTEAHYLSNLAQKVYLIIRKDQFKTIQPKYRDEVLARPNVEVLYQTSVQAFQKTEKGLSLSLAAPSGIQKLGVDGAFLAIGSLPNTDLFKGKLELDSEGYIVLKNQQETSATRIFAAGDVSDKTFKQAMTAAGDATKAALQAQQYLGSSTSLASTAAAKSSVKELYSLASLRTAVSFSGKPVVVYFSSKHCPPCRSFTYTYEAWASQYQEKALFVKVIRETAPDCFDAFRIDCYPTVLILTPKGKLLYQGCGLNELSKVPSVLEKS